MAQDTPPALHLDGLRKSFGKTEIIRGIDLAISKGERHASSAPTARANPRCST